MCIRDSIRNARFIAIYELASNEAIESLLQGPKYGAKARVQTMGKGSASLVVDSHVERLIPPTQAGRSGQPCVGDRSQCILAFQYHHLAKGSERDWMAVVILGPKSAVRQNDMTEALACSRRTTSKDALIRNTYQPVSYTHLDVYKRQSQRSPESLSRTHYVARQLSVAEPSFNSLLALS